MTGNFISVRFITHLSVDKLGVSGIIKAVTIEDFENIKGSSSVSNECIDKIYEILGDNKKFFNSVKIVNLKPCKDGKRDLLRTNLVQNVMWCDAVLEINQDVFGGLSLDEIENIIKMSNLAGHNVGDCLADMVTHEIAHARLVYCKQFGQAMELSAKLLLSNYKEYAKTISKVATYSDEECIAECYVLLQKGKKIPEELKPLIEK